MSDEQGMLSFGADATRADQIYARFVRFHHENPEIWVLFQQFCAELIGAGRRHYSVDAVVHRIRWHVDIDTKSGDGLKINDHFTAYYARMWLAVHPEFPGFFQLRVRRSTEQAPYPVDLAVCDEGPPGDESALMLKLRALAGH